MLKLSNMHSGMNGVYKVTSKAKYCQFHKEIRVEVYGEEIFDDVYSACLTWWWKCYTSLLATSELRKRPGNSDVDNASRDCFWGRALRPLKQSHDALSTSLLPGLLRNSEVANLWLHKQIRWFHIRCAADKVKFNVWSVGSSSCFSLTKGLRSKR